MKIEQSIKDKLLVYLEHSKKALDLKLELEKELKPNMSSNGIDEFLEEIPWRDKNYIEDILFQK